MYDPVMNFLKKKNPDQDLSDIMNLKEPPSPLKTKKTSEFNN